MVSDKNKTKKGSARGLNKRDAWISLLLAVVIVVLLNVAGNFFYYRLDLTSEKRYSISAPTQRMLENLQDDITIKVYLTGELNAKLERLRKSTENMLKEFRSYGGRHVDYEFFDPMAIKDADERKKFVTDLMQRGMAPMNAMSQTSSSMSETVVFPFAVVRYGNREFPVNLLENQLGYSPDDIVNHSEILLEYKLANAINKLSMYRPPRIGFVEGNGELTPLQVTDLRQSLEALQYEVRTINLPEVASIPERFDAIVIAKPTIAFGKDGKDKYKIDQYIMRGGKVLWLLEGTNADMDSVNVNPSGQFAQPTDLNLDDMLFKYGVRINNDVIQDIALSDQIQMVVGKVDDRPQTKAYKWYYYPLLVSDNNQAIVRNLDPVAAYFASSIDTVKSPGIRKTVLLHTTDYAKAQLAPTRIHFGILMSKPNPEYYNQPKLPVAVLLEGSFTSAFKNWLTPETVAALDTVPDLKYIENGKPSKQIVIGDGDMIRNEIRSDSSVYQLGFNKFTNQRFANKDFLLNCIEYLTDASGIFETRNKEVKTRLLNTVKAQDEKLKWQLINLALPIGLTVLFGVLFYFVRRRKYAR